MALRRGILVCSAALFMMSGCDPSVSTQLGLETDPKTDTKSDPKHDPETALESDEFLTAGEGMCAAVSKIYTETLPDSAVDPTDLPLTKISGFPLPSGIGTSETREIFRTAAAFRTYFGVAAPAGIDWSKEWVLFYSPGSATQPAAQPNAVRVRVRAASLRVTTTLQQPSSACSGFPPEVPFVLVKFTAPTLSSCRAYYYHRTDSVPCPAVPEPGPSCAGSLTDAGISRIVATRPPDNIDFRSTYATRKGRLLGTAKLERWQRSCSSTGCMPWTPLPFSYLLAHYSTQLRFHLKTYDTYPSELYTTSARYACGEPGTGYCWAESWIAYDIKRSATHGYVEHFRIDEILEAHGDQPIDDRYSDLADLPVVMTDQCVLLRSLKRADTGPTTYTETLLKGYVSW